METSAVQTKKTKILNYINIFRGLAILLIIMGHTMQFGNSNSVINLLNCEMICGGTALFIFISGFLFQHLSGKYEFKNYMLKKWTNVIMPYLFVETNTFIFEKIFKKSYEQTNMISEIEYYKVFYYTGKNAKVYYVDGSIRAGHFVWLIKKGDKW